MDTTLASRDLSGLFEEAEVDYDFFTKKQNPQSMAFMAELMPLFERLYPTRYHIKTLLDVGARTGSGTEFLATVLSPDSYSRLKCTVTALDIDPRMARLCRALRPQLEYLVADIFEIHDRQWDIVLCSHCLEHVLEPEPFLMQLRRLAREHVVISIPFREDPETRIKPHLHSFDETFLEAIGAENVTIYDGFHWPHSQIATFSVPPL
ncbi:bifunctional 2-polyprenyl-6-hydroxyphenol methylase/3-demethylubiquinol 3-O-methyltransferase UbiG [Rhodovulum sp. MB263]|uniref:class I SAM-dependent methyltransferase n=1 Tax=Rhodovulum sp. (strain MB263) TaxID=308754 RepID=UPI0018C89C83|nr:class I SAM-dependent methyltransferase [Rhodovulum sp. MB263]